MDVREHIMQPVGQAGDLSGQVIVVTGQDGQLGDGLLVGSDPAQGVRQGTGGVGDDEGVTSVSLGLTRMQIRKPTHGQPREVGDDDAHAPGYGDRERANRRHLVDDCEHLPMRLQLTEQRPQCALIVG